ncbi:MAG TPA: metallopeptidase TldD-related protein [Vicinamibacterales bacterium]|nr:metallopeptidase TldD-related protein [Vicinamibacterales bacterium]
MPSGVVPSDQYSEHGAGGALITLQDTIEQVLRLSKADACIVIARRVAGVNIRWAHNTVTTNGDVDEVQLSIVSIVGRRVASVTRTHFPPERLEEMVRESAAACARRPEAPDYMELPEGSSVPSDWGVPPADADIHVLDPLVPQLRTLYERSRAAGMATFGYAESQTTTVLLATSTGVRRRHTERIGKVEITAKTPDFVRSTWVGQVTHDFLDVDLRAMFDTLQQRLAWSARRIDMPAGSYEVLLEPSCAADLAIAAYWFMARRDADEGRSPYSRPGGGARIGERLFGDLTLYSDPAEPAIEATPFCHGLDSGSASSVFDNGLPIERTDWVRDGALQDLITPRYWAAKVGATAPAPYVNNLIVTGDGPSLSEMIAQTDRALLVTCFWYIRTVDPQTALLTGLTRDGVFLVEHGKVKGAVNNFRWNMSPIAALAQAIQIGRSGMAVPREHDEFLRAKAPALRVARFNMSSVSDAT